MTVSEILERRLAFAEAPKGLGPAVSALAHVTFVVLLVLVSRPRPIPFVPIALPVRVVSPASLPGRSAPAAAPLPVPTAAPAPEPVKKKPVIEKLRTPEKIVPSKSAMPEPTTRKKWLEPTPVPAAGVRTLGIVADAKTKMLHENIVRDDVEARPAHRDPAPRRRHIDLGPIVGKGSAPLGPV